MNKKEIGEKLTQLIQLDFDAAKAYEQALENIDDENIHARISSFRDDHMRHIDDLSEAMREMGETPPHRSRDIKGFLITGFTTIRSMTGTQGALKAMRMNERLTNSMYENALDWDLPPEVMRIVRKNREDERRHIEYIEQTLERLAQGTAPAV